MPYPHKGDDKQDFISRFMGSPEALRDYPEEKQRAAVAYGIWEDRRNALETKWEDMPAEEQETMLKILSQPAKARENDDEKTCQAIADAKRRIAELKEGRQTADNKERIKQYEDQIAYLEKNLENDQRKNSRGQTGHVVPMRFIEPGLVHYNDVGTVLVRKETLDRMLPSIVGKPIFNESHKEVSDDDFTQGKAQGIVAGNPRFNPGDGWFWIDGLIWDDETRQNGKDGYSLSCAYDVTKWGPAGVHNNIPYDREVLGGEYTHLAIVNNPRYEGAKLIINQGGHMKLKFWEKDKPTEPKEMELANAKTDVNGTEMEIEKVIELANAELKRQDDLKNSKATDDSIIEVGGQKMTVKEAKELAAKALKNASEDAMEKAHKDGKHDDKEMDNCPMCNSRKNAEEKEKAEKEKKEKEERENAKYNDEHEKGEHDEKPRENCLSCKAETARKNAQHFEDLKNSRNRHTGEFHEPKLQTVTERVAEGTKRYGPK